MYAAVAFLHFHYITNKPFPPPDFFRMTFPAASDSHFLAAPVSLPKYLQTIAMILW